MILESSSEDSWNLAVHLLVVDAGNLRSNVHILTSLIIVTFNGEVSLLLIVETGCLRCNGAARIAGTSRL